MGFSSMKLCSVSKLTLHRFLIFVCQQMIWLMLLPHLVTGNCYFTLSNVMAWNLYIGIMILFILQFLICSFIICCTKLSIYFSSLQLFWLYKCFSCKFLSAWPSCLFDMHILLELRRTVLIASKCLKSCLQSTNCSPAKFFHHILFNHFPWC